MKRFLSVIISVFMILQILYIPAFSQDIASDVVFTLSKVSGKPGDTVEVEVNVSSTVAYNSVALHTFEYDKTALTFVGFTDYAEIENKCYFPGGFDDLNQAIALALKTSEALDGYICKIKFTINDTAASGDYTISMKSLIKNNSTEITSRVEAGCITVTGDNEAHTHSMSYVEAVSGTCNAEGNIAHWYCSGCQKKYSDEAGTDELTNIASPIVSTNHTGGTEVKNAKEATATEDGYTGDTYCLGCGNIIESGKTIPALGEEITSVVFTVSDVTGKPGDTVEVEVNVSSTVAYNSVALHTFEYDETALTFVGFTDYAEIENKCYFPGGFDDANEAIALALKTSEALDGYICKIKFTINDTAANGDYTISMKSLIKNNSTEIASSVEPGVITVKAEEHVHSMAYTAAKEATCIEAGNEEYWYCSGCQKYYSDEQGTNEITDVSIPVNATNHKGDTEIKDAVEATCGKDGYTGDTYCKDCGEKTATGEVISATGKHTGGDATCKEQAVCEVCGNAYGELNSDNHKGDTEVKDTVEETCGKDGYTGDTYCKDCGEKIANGTVIPATGKHADSDNDKLCDVCGTDLSCKHTGETEIKNAIEATCGKDGYTGDTYCKDCGEKTLTGAIIPATGNHTGGEATCKDQAICEVCGNTYGELDADNHKGATEVKDAVEETCGKDGYTGDIYCKDCGEKTATGTVIPATGKHTGGEATCKDQAICEVCGNAYGELDADNHKGETEVKDAVEANCGKDGYTGDTYCKDCGEKTASGEVIPATGKHTGGEATCKDQAICEVCGNTYGELDADNHKGETEVKDAAEATCNEDGYTGDTYCKDCGEKTATGTVIPATGKHTGGEATCKDQAICEVCGNAYGELDADNHKGETEVKDATEATCNEDGYTGDTYCKDCGKKTATGEVIPATGKHTGGEATCKDQAVCEVCGNAYGELDADNHKGETEVKDAAEATCGKDGYTGDTYCKDCGEKTATGTVIPATGKHTDNDGDELCDVCETDLSCKHTGESEVKGAVEATCNEEGYTGDTYCKDCGEKIATGTVIPATGKHTGGEATCKDQAICEVCGNVYGELDADNHKGETEVKDAVEATCGKDGYTGDTYCKDCGEKTATGTVIPATGKHVDDNEDEVCDVCDADLSCKHTGKIEIKDAVEATCVQEGYTGDTYCKDCGEKIKTGTVIPATGKHTPSQWIIDEEATEDETGLKHKECVVCGLVLETEEIPVVDSGFDFNDWYWILAQLMNQKFTITAEAGEGGFISNEGKTTVKYNNSITYYITPAEGYDIDAVYVNGRNIGVTNEYTFKNVRSNQNISVTFVRTAWDNPFIDIADDAEYIDAIEFVYENGLFKGVSDIEFAPETTMTRAMFVTVLGRLADVDTAYYTDSSFDDVVEGEWYAPYVEWAAEYGIVLGYGDGTFGVNDKITVEQATVILARYAEYTDEYEDSNISLKKYADADKVSDWALEAMKWSVDNDIYTGISGKLEPQNPAPRALIATMIYNYAKEFEFEE